MKNIKQIQYEVSKESRFDNWDLFLRCERYKPSLIDNKWTLVCERYAQQYIEANKELVEMLEEFTNAVETEEIIIKENYDNDGWENCGNRLYEKAKLLINKYNQNGK